METVYDLTAWRDQALEALGAQNGIPFQPRQGGEIFTVPHPLTLDDDKNKELEIASGAMAIASVLLGGSAVYARFVAAGGRAGDVMMAYKIMQQGVTLDPTLSAFIPWSAGAHASSNLTSSIAIPASADLSINGGELSSPVQES
ncbi:hypothetical protein [Nocardia niigatensis]|uniref:hypothetical protein n=1 Tax=Nocardia niigatensis TaxID=209249 RepID=UPI0002EF1A4A|nr:hypothetical protein [Nocardia niigatensis]